MSRNNLRDARFSDICSEFPLIPIEDDGSYRAAIDILDRLFALDDPRDPAEVEYFRTLANLAYQYESRSNGTKLNPSEDLFIL
jgi:hypothetical protein